MTTTRWIPLEKVKAKNVTELNRSRVCSECGSQLLRLAIRETWYPYRWVVTGYRCSGCDNLWLEES